MTTSRIRTATRLLIATIALGATALASMAAAPTGTGGLRNCVDIGGRQFDHVGCYENVWADGAEYRMTFANTSFAGATPRALDPFYLVAPQTESAQGYPPRTFPHDHVVRATPAANGATYSVKLQGFFVLCSGHGIVSGACVPSWTPGLGPDPVPFAATVEGRPLRSTSAIESAADAGLVVLLDLGPGAVIVGTISGR